MRAVYESDKPYTQIGYWDVNATVPAYSEAKITKNGIIMDPQIVGSKVNLPDSIMERARVYLFSEGLDHNQLTLTDPREILNMRAFIRSKDQIKEIYCEGDPVEELSKLVEAEEYGEDLSEEFEEDFEEYEDDELEDPEDEPSYSEWDEQMARRLDR